MQIIICDDEIQILNELTTKMKVLMPNDVITAVSSGEELLHVLKDNHCDVLFLDIDMPGFSGMDIAQRLNDFESKPLLVFVTSHDELVYESIQYHPFGFIRKSYFDKEIQKVVDDCKKELSNRDLRFHFRMANQDIVVLLSDILYFEADGNYINIYAINGEYRFRSTVAEVENKLSGKGFCRVHKGFLVNQAAVKIIGKDTLELNDGTVISIGKSYMEEAKKHLIKSMRL